MRVAFVGLGTMGLPLARRLVGAGHDVVACDLAAARAEALGATTAATPVDAALDAQAVLVSLPSPATVEEVLRAIATSARPGTLVVDLSTSPPALSRRLAVELGGIDLLDAPVSGGPRGADAGTLTIMVGGDEVTFERARPLLEAMGQLVVRVGGHGAGQVAKLCNNLIAGTTMVAITEACELAEREQIDPATLYELLSASTGDSRVLRNRYPVGGVDDAHPSSHGFAPLFALDLIAKDMALALELAAVSRIAAPVARAALSRYREAQRAGRGALDYSAVNADALPARAEE